MGHIKAGDAVNLERCMLMGGRLDGHIVQGHVDQTGTCTEITEEDGSWLIDFAYDPTLQNVTVEKGPVPGIFAMRFVKQTQATLGFTKFPITSMIEINGITWEGNDRIPGLKDVGRMMIEVLQENNIEFTIHWGKNANWEFPGLLEYMFDANAISQWREARGVLLSDEMKQVFSNKFLQDLGL